MFRVSPFGTQPLTFKAIVRRDDVSDGTFQAVGNSDERMFGPRKIIVCGFSPADQNDFRKMTAELGMNDISVISAGAGQASATLGEVVDMPDGTGHGEASELDRTVILSGLTENELGDVMMGYRRLGQPRALWAALTESSIEWTLSALIKDLVAEREALQKKYPIQ